MAITLSAEKLTAAQAFADLLVPGRRVVLTTHVNPDGDGLGSEAGLVLLLRETREELAFPDGSRAEWQGPPEQLSNPVAGTPGAPGARVDEGAPR